MVGPLLLGASAEGVALWTRLHNTSPTHDCSTKSRVNAMHALSFAKGRSLNQYKRCLGFQHTRYTSKLQNAEFFLNS